MHTYSISKMDSIGKDKAKTFALPLLGTSEGFVTLALFRNVTNSAELRKMAQTGQIEAAVLNPRLLCGEFHVLAAVNKAVTRRADDQMKTKTIYSEIIYSLSPSTNISESFRNFGVQDDSTSIMVVVFGRVEGDDQKVIKVLNMVQGEVITLDDMLDLNDASAIRKMYKVPEEECAILSLENSIVTRISTRDAL